MSCERILRAHLGHPVASTVTYRQTVRGRTLDIGQHDRIQSPLRRTRISIDRKRLDEIVHIERSEETAFPQTGHFRYIPVAVFKIYVRTEILRETAGYAQLHTQVIKGVVRNIAAHKPAALHRIHRMDIVQALLLHYQHVAKQYLELVNFQ